MQNIERALQEIGKSNFSPDLSKILLHVAKSILNSFDRSLHFALIPNGTYKITADERLIEKVNEQLMEEFDTQKKQLTAAFAELVIMTGYNHKWEEISAAFTKDLGLIRFRL